MRGEPRTASAWDDGAVIDAGVVGLGRWGRHLVDAVQERGRPLGNRIRFRRALVRRRAPDLEAFASAHGLELVSDLQSLLAAGVDAVVVAAPISALREYVVAAAAAGKHVFVEKPFALEPEHARTAFAACAAASVVVAVDYQFRFLPACQRLHELVKGGTIGEPIHLDATLSTGHAHYWPAESWRLDPDENPGGPVSSLGSHMLDLMVDIAGPVRQAAADVVVVAGPGPVGDVGNVLVRFESGATGHLAAVSSSWPGFRLAAYGSRGWAQVLHRTTLEVATPGTELLTEDHPVGAPERAALEAFAVAAVGGEPYPVEAAQVVHVVAVSSAIASSARHGSRWVEVRS
jgi:predicted dehydrogenase